MKTETISARGGLAFRVSREQRLRLITPKGAQAADFFAYAAENAREWLSPMHTWVTTRSIKPRGDTSSRASAGRCWIWWKTAPAAYAI
jgi:uncharacterized protein YcgI (DUF1989 family)